ncbi:hypothetical protein [Caldimonas brevitalea]|nr:hypothetical protein [Caldimonas brevitalea]
MSSGGAKLGSVVVAALALTACPAKPTDGSWAAFNGFYPGMSLQDAKGAGAINCKETSSISKEVQCDIPPHRRALGPFNARSARLVFYISNQHRLSRMFVHFHGPHFNALCHAAAEIYGAPVIGSGYFWYRAGTPADIELPMRGSSGDPTRTFMEFRYEPELADPKNDPPYASERGCLPAE